MKIVITGFEIGIKEYYSEEVFMNKIRLISVSIFFLLILNGCSIYKKGTDANKAEYSINFIEYNKKYKIDIDNDGETDSVKVFIDEDGCIWVEVNNQKNAIGYGEKGIKSTIISDNNGNYCIGIAIHYDNDARISELFN